MTQTAPLPAEASPKVDYVALPAGAVIGRYEVVSVLGHGGFGITYLARDAQLDREVAIKEYLPAALAVRQDGVSVLPRSTEVADDFGWGRSRFIEEGRTLANLHEAPSIVEVFDFLEANGTAYIVMELLRGKTLEARVNDEGPLSPAELDAILWPLLTGLQQVHEAGFLHRDIKPANIVLGAHKVATLIDFGASRAAMADRTRTLTAIFTPGYAAPEQFSSAKQGPWTDIYCLSATLYYAITGKAPPSAFDRLMSDTYEPLLALRPEGFPQATLQGIDAGLSIQFEQRPHSISDWRAVLRGDSVDGEETLVMPAAALPPQVAAPPPQVTPPTPPTLPRMTAPTVVAALKTERARSRRGWMALVVAIVLPAMAGAYYLFAPTLVPQAPPPAEPAPAQQAAIVQPARPAPQAPQPPAGEAEEMALKLSTSDRQRVQIALTALGFDTRGNDGTFGPRSREMIAAWQQSRKRPATGYLSAGDNQALRDVQAAASRRPAAESAAPAETQPPEPDPLVSPPVSTPVPPAPPVIERVYHGSLSGSATGGGQSALAPVVAELRLIDRRLTGRLVHPVCGSLPVSLALDTAGAINGNLRLYELTGCATNQASASGRMRNGTLALDLRSSDVSFHGTLSLRASGAPTTPAAGQRTGEP
jgi:serine/threonine protein kinase